ncbi:hypothetical protein [Spirosoma sp.]|uniref:hypothetical protein n=1 Tax=Spirosoma sp. TaxID=1899569 RepID=UPI003B3B6129
MKFLITWYCLLNLGIGVYRTNAQPGYPPPCDQAKQVKLDTDENKRQILLDFIRSCKEKYWFNNKGIILLREHQNAEGKQCWLLLPSIDDSYKDNPPSRFASFNGDIILISDAYSNGRAKPTAGDRTGLNQCLQQIIGDRVYTRPTMQREASRMYRGSLIVVFNLDGSYEKLLPL